MADKISPLDRAKAVIDLIKQRADLSHKFGEFDSLRRVKAQEGDCPWRVLRYEHILDPAQSAFPIPRLKLVRPAIFEKHMHYLATNCRVVSLESLLDEIHSEQTIPDRTVALTFDCGWVDQFAYAVPILRKFNLPATFFLPTAFIGTNNYFWQDKIMFAMLMMKEAGMKFIPFDFISAEERKALETISPDGEISLDYISAVVFIMQGLRAVEMTAALTILGEIAEHLGGALPSQAVFMGWEDVKLLKHAGFDLGSLGHRRVSFSNMSEDEFLRDTISSFSLLEGVGMCTSKLLALPEEYITEGLEHKLSKAKTFDFVLGIQPPGSQTSMVNLEEVLIVLRTAINELSMSNTESFATQLWL